MRRIVCSANRLTTMGRSLTLLGVRHFDDLMIQQLKRAYGRRKPPTHASWEQGFIDSEGRFLTREEAWDVAYKAGQIIRRVGGDEGRLFSENLW